MGLIPVISYPKRTLKRKLFGYMLLLVSVLLLTLMSGLFLFGRFRSTEQDIYDTLNIQMDVFEKDITAYFDHLAAAGIRLSESMGAVTEDYLLRKGLRMADLTNNPDALLDLQEAMLEPLKLKLLQEDCSGVFVLLDATVNSGLPSADHSRAGLYLQINGYDTYDQNILLFRGPADLAKQHGMMPHRKWKLEFSTERFPNFEEIAALSHLPADQAYFLTDLHNLPGTSDQVVLMVLPITGSDGACYGLCGMEVSSSYFMAYHAQPAKISHLTCLVAPGSGSTLDAAAGLSCGVSGGYYRAPNGTLSFQSLSNDLLCLQGDWAPYIGVIRTVSLTPNRDAYTLAVMIPKEDLDQSSRKATLQNTLLWLLIIFFAVNCCLFFSRRFLTPLLKGLEQLKSKERARSNIPEIDDLFAFLSKQDREYEQMLQSLTQEKQQAQLQYEHAQTEISRLSYKMKQEVDPDDFQYFQNGLLDLTPTERKVFNLYFDGKSAKEILEILQIKENTLKFHNKGIYSKLGVNSRKQLLQYAALLKQQTS